MRCPVCESTDLAISSREGVEIDYCPQCRGVWLDRGELDKIIDRAATTFEPSAARQAPRGERSRGRDDDDDDRRDRSYGRDDDRRDRGDESFDPRSTDPRRRRRRSFLDDIFDFD